MELFRSFKDSGLGGGTDIFMLVLGKWDLEGGFENIWKILKLSTSSITFYWYQQLLSKISKVANI